jgi:hypothetical protein
VYVFSIDIPFKGSQSLWNMRSMVKAVSYLHSGVIYTAVHVTAVSLIPLCMLCAAESDFTMKNSVSDFCEDVRKKVGCTAVSMTPM